MQVLLNGLADELVETVLAVGHVHGLFFVETAIPTCWSWGYLLFVLFGAAAVDWGDREDAICEMIVAFL